MMPEQQLFALYLATAEKVSDRRQQTNAWMLSVHSALLALLGLVGAGKAVEAADDRGLWMMAVPVAGIMAALAWTGLLESFRKLNEAKFKVIHEMEKALPFQPFQKERAFYTAQDRSPLSAVERWVPWAFLALYAAALLPLMRAPA
ncbi:MAG: hypothetical protein HQL39_08040 [Alphaproteobacteria bacterium]|nr:hypothetical protein [Alphaproteobacteria bacterium]